MSRASPMSRRLGSNFGAYGSGVEEVRERNTSRTAMVKLRIENAAILNRAQGRFDEWNLGVGSLHFYS